MATDRIRAKYFRGENRAGIDTRHRTSWAATLALLFGPASTLCLPLDTTTGVAS